MITKRMIERATKRHFSIKNSSAYQIGKRLKDIYVWVSRYIVQNMAINEQQESLYKSPDDPKFLETRRYSKKVVNACILKAKEFLVEVEHLLMLDKDKTWRNFYDFLNFSKYVDKMPSELKKLISTLQSRASKPDSSPSIVGGLYDKLETYWQPIL